MSIPSELVPKLIQKILTLGREQYPLEACGMICPDGHVVRLRNQAETPEREFELKADDMRQAVVSYILRCNDPNVEQKEFVIWHTHPSGSEGPSELDKVQRDGSSFQYLVVAMPDGPATWY